MEVFWKQWAISRWHTWQRGRVWVDTGSPCPAQRKRAAPTAFHPLASTLGSLPGPAVLLLSDTVIGSREWPRPAVTHLELDHQEWPLEAWGGAGREVGGRQLIWCWKLKSRGAQDWDDPSGHPIMGTSVVETYKCRPCWFLGLWSSHWKT